MRAARARAAATAWFGPSAPALSLAPLGAGHINDTWLLGVGSDRFVLQRVNERVFPDSRSVMQKVAAVVAHLTSSGRVPVPALVPTAAGLLWHEDPDQGVWRVTEFVAPARTLRALENPEQAEAAGRAFGAFQRALEDLPAAVPDPIPGFLQLRHYRAELEDAVAVTDPGPEVAAVLAALQSRMDLAGLFQRRDRLVHGDCKVDNLLFHAHSDEVVCVLDLDTVMVGNWAWDFGDLVRSAAATADGFDLLCYAGVVRGFFGSGAAAPDVDAAVLAPRYVTLMLAVRFLTDHLRGDRYFKVDAPGDNLQRARQQLGLLEAMERLEARMRAVAAG